jgi:acyl-CoA dehydrogenase
LREELQAAGRAAGLFAPHVGTAFGGLGLDVRGQAPVFEEAGYSLLGPLALNCSAPDEGNMHLLEAIASPEQQERYLRPLAAGEVRSAFAMTEPAPGAGSDPTMLLTTARQDGSGWVIDGRKHLITGAQGSAFSICMARTAAEIRHDEGATMFLVESDNPGMRIERLIPTMDRAFSGGHAVVAFDACRVPADAVLGEAGLGYRYAQVRLAPARLTHCMRWLGLARRALDVALDSAATREAFGAPLLEQGMVQALVADSVIDIEAGRGLIRACADVLDAGGRGAHESSVAKVFVSEAVGRVVDRSLQICGGLGASEDLPLARYAREVRAFRIYDGPSETHRWSIARRAARRRRRES